MPPIETNGTPERAAGDRVATLAEQLQAEGWRCGPQERATPDVPTPPLPGALSPMEQAVLEVLASGQILTGPRVAELAGYPYETGLKTTLAALRRRGLIVNHAPGYARAGDAPQPAQQPTATAAARVPPKTADPIRVAALLGELAQIVAAGGEPLNWHFRSGRVLVNLTVDCHQGQDACLAPGPAASRPAAGDVNPDNQAEALGPLERLIIRHARTEPEARKALSIRCGRRTVTPSFYTAVRALVVGGLLEEASGSRVQLTDLGRRVQTRL